MPWSPRLPKFSWQPPLRAFALSEWALLPLRAFLGVTFLYAGLQKLANPNFFRAASGISIQNQLSGAARFSPIHSLLHAMLPYAGTIGLVVAYAEIAIGLGTLLGLYARTAAFGGALLSFNLFLAVSFHSSPYYTGADLVFFFAFLPLMLAGAGQQLSLDGYLTRIVRSNHHVAGPELVALPFAQLQQLCGNYADRACRALSGAACRADACPVLLGTSAPIATPVTLRTIERRRVVLGGATAVAAGTAALIVGGATAALGKLIGGAGAPTGGQTAPTTSTTTTTSPSGTPVKGHLIGAVSAIPVGSAATFTIPATGDPGIVFHTTAGNFVAYDSVCPHAGCQVGWSKGASLMVCPCHGSTFEVANGSVVNGPASSGLTPLTIVEHAGHLYLQ